MGTSPAAAPPGRHWKAPGPAVPADGGKVTAPAQPLHAVERQTVTTIEARGMDLVEVISPARTSCPGAGPLLGVWDSGVRLDGTSGVAGERAGSVASTLRTSTLTVSNPQSRAGQDRLYPCTRRGRSDRAPSQRSVGVLAREQAGERCRARRLWRERHRGFATRPPPISPREDDTCNSRGGVSAHHQPAG